jgi:hypothetical protein
VGSAAADASHEADMASRVNALRASRGLSQLIVDERIGAVARNWAAQIGAQGSLVHNPNASSQIPPGWSDMAENLAYGPDVATMQSQLENDPPHMANMLNPRFTHMGVGIIEANGRLWAVQNFAAYGSANYGADPYYGQSAYDPWAAPSPQAVAAAPPPSPPITAAAAATPVAIPAATPAPAAPGAASTSPPAAPATAASANVAFTGGTTQDHVKIGAGVLLLGMLLASVANLRASKQ